MEEGIQRALARDRTIDITTTGWKSGQLYRTEIWFYHLDGNLSITGTPGWRDWYANLVAHPAFTFHLKRTVQADLPARATPILEPAQRREILARMHQNLGRGCDLEVWVAGSPLVQVVLLRR